MRCVNNFYAVINSTSVDIQYQNDFFCKNENMQTSELAQIIMGLVQHAHVWAYYIFLRRVKADIFMHTNNNNKQFFCKVFLS